MLRYCIGLWLFPIVLGNFASPNAFAEESPSAWFAGLVRKHADKLRHEEALSHLSYQMKFGMDEESTLRKKVEEEKARAVESEKLCKESWNNIPSSAPNWLRSLKEIRHEIPEKKETLDFLGATYPQPLRLSSWEWQALRDLLGPGVEEAFLTQAYQAKPLPYGKVANTKRTDFVVLLIVDPFVKIEATAKEPEWQALKNYLKGIDFAAEEKSLQKLGYKVTVFASDSLDELDNDASEFGHFLEVDEKQNQVPLLLVSSGEGSGILHRYFDAHPGQRKNPHIYGWINLNGRLHGLPMSLAMNSTARAPASAKENHCPMDQLERGALASLGAQQNDRHLSIMPLGQGFPIFNVLRWGTKERATPNPVDSIESSGNTFLVLEAKTKEDLGRILQGLGL